MANELHRGSLSRPAAHRQRTFYLRLSGKYTYGAVARLRARREMMISEQCFGQTIEAIAEANEDQTAQLVVASLERLGNHGRPCAVILLALAKQIGDDSDLTEGLAWIEAVEGVFSGRTDSL